MKKKLIATLLTASLLIPTPVYAGTEVTSPGDQTVPIQANMPESYTVTLPTSITLNNTKEQTYGVTVKGDILDTTTISVEPDATFTLQRQNSSSNTTANVVQTKTSWSADEVNTSEGTTTSGTIQVPGLTAGDWSGTLNFTVSVNN